MALAVGIMGVQYVLIGPKVAAVLCMAIVEIREFSPLASSELHRSKLAIFEN